MQLYDIDMADATVRYQSAKHEVEHPAPLTLVQVQQPLYLG